MKKTLPFFIIVLLAGCASSPSVKTPSHRDNVISAFNHSNESVKAEYRICNLYNSARNDVFHCRVRAIDKVLTSCALISLCNLLKQKKVIFKKIAFNVEDFEGKKISIERYNFNHDNFVNELKRISREYDLQFKEDLRVLRIQEWKASERNDRATEGLLRSIGSVLSGQNLN
jgi:hypothetical protein